MYEFAASDVWGIGTTGFLWGYWAAIAALLAATLAYGAPGWLGSRQVDPDTLSPASVAYLAGGEWPAIYVSLTWLRVSDAISASHGVLATAGPRPWGATPLDRAVHRAAARGVMVKQLASDTWVARAVRALRAGLERTGLAARSWVRRWFVATASTLLAVGLARLVAEWIDGALDLRLVWPLLVLGVGAAGLAYLLSRPANRAGAYAVARLRYDHQDLTPAGPHQVAMHTALFGPQALLDSDPEFATEVWVWETDSDDGTGRDWRYHRGDDGPTAGSRYDEPDRSFFGWGGHGGGGSGGDHGAGGGGGGGGGGGDGGG